MKQKIVPLMMLMLFAVVLVLATGCASPGMTKKDVHRRHINTFQNDIWQMRDDIDAFLLIDRPSRLSPMMVR
ncbi:MAG: hypothetical protein ISS71_07465 [Phycisphaerae bacterium]|nr:hypothetical protein [Phycisphaerae bacterium]